VGLLISIDVVFPSLIRSQVLSPDYGHNLISELWGILATVLLFMIILDLREELLKKSLKKKLFERIGTELHDNFTVITKFVEVSEKAPLDQLKELSNKEKLEMSQGAYKYFPKPESPVDAFSLNRLLKSRERLGDLELKFLESMEPNLRLSLMEIQYNLDRLHHAFYDLSLLDKESFLVDSLIEMMLKPVHTIIKEIYKIHKMGIEIRPRTVAEGYP